MASQTFRKLRALMTKNLIEMRRNILSTLCEIFFPIIVMIVFLLIRSAITIKTHTFENEEISVKDFIYNRSTSNFYYSENQSEWYGLSLHSPLHICTMDNSKKWGRPRIATIGVPDEIKEQMITDYQFFKDIRPFDRNNFTDFSTIEEFKDYMKNSSYGSRNNPEICFGIFFSYKDNEYNYSMHYFDNKVMNGAEDIPASLYLLDRFQVGPDMESYEKYQKNGYTYIMKLINDYILKNATNKNDIKLNFGVLPMKYENYRTDSAYTFLAYIGPFFIFIAYIGHLSKYAYKMALEKETKAKEGMKIMGLTDGIYFMSYFIQYIVIALFDAFINTLILLNVFKQIPFVVFFLLFFLFSMNVFALAFLFQSFINKAKEAKIISIHLYIILFFLCLLIADESSSYGMKVGLSLFPTIAIYNAIILLSKFESHFRPFHKNDIFEIYTNYSIIVMIIMLLVDILLYLFLGYYLQNVLPHDFGIRKPWYFIFKKLFCIKSKEQVYSSNYEGEKDNNNSDNEDKFTNIPSNENFQSEEIYKDMTHQKDSFRIRNLVKQFGNGKAAVDHINLNFYKNEIFALLGHSGAGKTTMISILTGLYEATAGEALYDGINILSPDNMDFFRQKVGICLQHDILFMDLNIREHLKMFALLKDVPSENIEAEVNKFISDFYFEDIQNTIAKNLSAGQRRKLSIAISLIGGSEIIFLDEPTSGMDITSRRNLWGILKRKSENKIIILTTHYMEEASALGKRIGILNYGKMKCIGNPLFLIEKFGKYISITLTKDENASNETIMSFLRQKVEQTQFEILFEEIVAHIPKNIFNKEGSISLQKFFEELDKNLKNLKVKSYSVSMPTLEDAFLNISSEDESQRESQEIKEEKKNDDILYGIDYLDNFENKSKFTWDFKANFIRRFYLMIRDKKGIIIEVLGPILLVLIGAIVSQTKFDNKTPDFESKDIPKIGNQIIYFAGSHDMSDYFIEGYHSNISSKNLENYSMNQDKNQAILDFLEFTFNITKEYEMTKDREVDMNNNNYKGNYANFLMLNEPNDNNKNYEFVELINARVVQGVPLYTSLFLETIIKKETNKKVTINYKNIIMEETIKQELSGQNQSKILIIILVSTAFSLMPVNFISIIVKERINNSKHLMKLSGLNIISYWFANFLFELIKYYFIAGICLIILKISNYYTPYLEYLYLLYGPPLILFTYVFSFRYKDEPDAQNKTLLINFLGGIVGPILVMILRSDKDNATHGLMVEYNFFPLPLFCFNFGYTLSIDKIHIYEIDYPDTWYNFEDKELLKHFNLLQGPMIILVFAFFIYLFVLFLIEICSHYPCCSSPTNEILLNEEKNDDEGVIKEKKRALNEEKDLDSQTMTNTKREMIHDTIDENLSNKEKEGKNIVKIKNFKKIFKISKIKYIISCCKNKGNEAIKNLSFCVEEGECFGILGLNGAGKSTTFKCITQEIYQTNGEILFKGENTQGNFGLIKNKFGYCPQYDTFFEYLTVYENLEFFAKLKGVKQEYLNELISALISEMRLQEFTKTISSTLSSGNKRKLSVAISMLGNPPILLLDEPTTGMDPEAKRTMWSVIHKIATNGRKSSIIMTTHSMDEAESLCKRMAIMVNGEFVCLGKANELKSKYGYGYELNLRVEPLTEEQMNELYYKKYNINNTQIVKEENIQEILSIIKKENIIPEIDNGHLGEKILKDIKKNNGIHISSLISWIFYAENAIKFIEYGREYFSEIIVEEIMENNFIFKMKKDKSKNITIGFLCGLFELHKKECSIAEYSIQQTSLEQIFINFVQNQKSMLAERGSTIVEIGDVENINSGEKINIVGEKIVLTKILSGHLLGDFEEKLLLKYN